MSPCALETRPQAELQPQELAQHALHLGQRQVVLRAQHPNGPQHAWPELALRHPGRQLRRVRLVTPRAHPSVQPVLADLGLHPLGQIKHLVALRLLQLHHLRPALTAPLGVNLHHLRELLRLHQRPVRPRMPRLAPALAPSPAAYTLAHLRPVRGRRLGRVA